MPSEQLKEFHDEHCPDIDIESIEFSYFLINFKEKLESEVNQDVSRSQ